MTAIPHPSRRPVRRSLLAAGAALAIVVGALTPTAAANAATPPTVTVAGATNIAGDSVTLTVTDVTKPSTSHPGIYVLFGAKTRFPSQPGTGTWGTYVNGMTDNKQHFLSFGAGAGSTGQLALQSDGRWDSGNITLRTPTSFTAQNGDFVNCKAATIQCGVIVIGAHGQASSDLEKFVPVTFAAGNTGTLPGTTNPTATGITITSITQEDAANCDAAGSDGLCVAYLVKGTAAPRLANNGQGFYLRYGWTDPSGWKPSDGYGTSTRVPGMYTAWVRPGAVGGYVSGSEAVEYELKSDGSFTAEVWAHQVPGHPMTSGNYGFFTVPAHGATGSTVSAWETKSALQIW